MKILHRYNRGIGEPKDKGEMGDYNTKNNNLRIKKKKTIDLFDLMRRRDIIFLDPRLTIIFRK